MLSGSRRVSSRQTFFLKRIFPVVWFAIAAATGAAALAGLRAGSRVPPVAFVAPLLLLVLGYALLRQLVFDLADEVYDTGDALVVRFGADEQRIPLEDIINVNCTQFVNPTRITLTLRHAGRFGREISFAPQRKLLGAFARNAYARELIERVEAARRR